MISVQIAIPDIEYGRELRTLLIRDGRHHVDLVETPDMSQADIIVMDVGFLDKQANLGSLTSRCIVFCQTADIDWSLLYRAGVRRVISIEHPPEVARLAVLGTERELNLGSDNPSEWTR